MDNYLFKSVGFLFFFTALYCGPQQDKQILWNPDEGSGRYRNPVIFADYSDPDVLRVGNDFYLISSSFNCVPGIPVLHSIDLVNWEIINHVFDRQIPDSVFRIPRHGKGCWAPSIRFHQGYFLVYFGDPDFGIYMSRTKNPAGEWDKPVLIRSARGWIDPCPFWDEDGKAYLIHAWAKSRAGFNSILTLHRMNADGSKILDNGVTIFDGSSAHPTIEGPKLYKRNKYYYIFAPAGGVRNGWQTVLRSENIYGPYEDRIVLEQGGTPVNGPHQGGWVESLSGESWFIHFQDRGAYGRIVHLQPMDWVDDWPVMGIDTDGNGIGEPVAEYRKPRSMDDNQRKVPQTSDEFSSGLPGLQWQWNANPDSTWLHKSDTENLLRMQMLSSPRNVPNLWHVPNLLMQKFPAPEFMVTTCVEYFLDKDNDRAGLLVMGSDYAYLGIRKSWEGDRIILVKCLQADKGNDEISEWSEPLNTGRVYLRALVSSGANVQFSLSFDNKLFRNIGTEFKAVPGKWIGARIGLFASAADKDSKGYIDVDWFRFNRIETIVNE